MEPDPPDPLDLSRLAPLPPPIADRLFEARTLLISGEIDQLLAGRVMAQLTALAASSDAPITVVINSQGGHVESGDTIHDYIRFVGPRVRMLGTGWVASAGALVYVAVPVEDRFCLPNTRFMLHQPSGGVRGPGSDLAIAAEQIVQMRARLNRIFAAATGQPLERIEADTDRDFWLDAAAARDYGLVGRIVQRADELDEAPRAGET